MQDRQFASVVPVGGGRHLHPGSVAGSPTVQRVKHERLELEGQAHMQENSNPTTNSQHPNNMLAMHFN